MVEAQEVEYCKFSIIDWYSPAMWKSSWLDGGV